MGKTTLLQEAHLLGPGLGIGGRDAEFAAQHLGRTLPLAGSQISLQFADRIALDAMAMQLGEDALVAIARRAAMYQGFGKTFFGKETGLLQPLEQGVDVVTLLRVRGKLTRKFQATVLT